MDCENCRHLTVVGLHDTGPWRLGRTKSPSCLCCPQRGHQAGQDEVPKLFPLSTEGTPGGWAGRGPPAVCAVHRGDTRLGRTRSSSCLCCPQRGHQEGGQDEVPQLFVLSTEGTPGWAGRGPPAVCAVHRGDTRLGRMKSPSCLCCPQRGHQAGQDEVPQLFVLSTEGTPGGWAGRGPPAVCAVHRGDTRLGRMKSPSCLCCPQRGHQAGQDEVPQLFVLSTEGTPGWAGRGPPVPQLFVLSTEGTPGGWAGRGPPAVCAVHRGDTGRLGRMRSPSPPAVCAVHRGAWSTLC